MSNYNLTRPNRLYRGIAIFFLIFTAFDLTSPTPCQEDDLGIFPIVRQAGHAVQAAPSLDSPSSQQPDRQPDSGAGEHDCFCCCTHLTPVAVISVADLNMLGEAIPRSITRLPLALPQDTDHPPRLA